eukprot:snap_masked-scaffold_8-processed-gene-13.42-mRNA-1 protein AED:1.00 eAED:1.00 QI:0/0/0/0/1/1/4/0/908
MSEQEIQTRTNEEETVSENSRIETLARRSEEETQTETDGDSSLLEIDYASDGESIYVSKKEARKFMKPLLAEDLYKKYFYEFRITFCTWLNRLFCCQTIPGLKNFQAKGREALYEDYMTFIEEYKSATTEQEKIEVEEFWKENFRNWNEPDIEKLGESDSRQHVQALLLIFLFYLQQVALILVGDVKYPEEWEKAVIWLKQIFLPNILYITDQTIKEVRQNRKSKNLLNFGKFFQFISYYLNNIIIPLGKERGDSTYKTFYSFFDRATRLLGILSFNLITPLASIILSLLLDNKNLVFKIIFSASGFILLVSVLYYYWKIGQEVKFLGIIENPRVFGEVYRKNFQPYHEDFTWVLILTLVEKIILAIINRVFTNEDELIGGWISLGILSLSFFFLYYFLPYNTKQLNQIDILTRFSNIIVLSIGIVFTKENSFSENLANILLFTISGITLFYWIFAFRETIFSPQDCLKYFPLFICIQFFHGGINKFLAKKRWKNIKTLDEAKKLLQNRKKKGISKGEWSVLSADQKVLFLCTDFEDYHMEGHDVETTEGVDLNVSKVFSSNHFDTILAGKLCSSIKVTGLKLDSRAFTEDSFSYILESNLLGRLRWLTALDIHDIDLSPNSNKLLFLSLLKGGFRIQELWFQYCFTSSEYFELLGEYLLIKTDLQSFSIFGSFDGSSESCNIILQSLSPEKLNYLELNTNGLDDTQIPLLSSILERASNLKTLYIKYEFSSEDTLRSFYEIFSKAKNSKELDITVETIGPQSIFVINEELYMMSNKNIKVWNIESKIREIFPEMKNLVYFDKKKLFSLSENRITDFSKLTYKVTRKGINSIVSYALSLLDLKEKEKLKQNMVLDRHGISIIELVHRYGSNRKKETLEAMYEIFGVEVYFREELIEQEEGEEEYFYPY